MSDRIRRAQLIAEATAVICPFCGDNQPDKTGSQLWDVNSFLQKTGKFKCVSCDKDMLISSDSKVMFR